MNIETVAVIGAGVMGGGIAAQIANAGKKVYLLDIVPDGADQRNILSQRALTKILSSQPAALMHPRNAKHIVLGNLEDDFSKLAEADWIIEVVIERLEVKQALYPRIDAVRKPGSIVSSNTSTLALSALTAGMSDSFCEDFVISHFFNPPRYMRLIELVAGVQTSAETLTKISDFCEIQLGKSLIHCKDTPGFIANRIGAYWMQTAMLEAFRLGLSVEQADAICGPPMGIPKTGVFALMDLVGIDLMPQVLSSMVHALPANDAFQQQNNIPELIRTMIADGYTGRKGKGGFYRIDKSKGQKSKQSINLTSGCYADSQTAKLASLAPAIAKDLRQLLNHPDIGGQYACSVLLKVLSYSLSLVPEISDDINAIDRAMKLGYNWKYGPFELVDRLGVDWLIKKFEDQQLAVPALLATAAGKTLYRTNEHSRQRLSLSGDYINIISKPGVLSLTDIKRQQQALLHTPSASVWDIGDGVLCLEFHSKMNAIDADILSLINASISLISEHYKALVIYNEADNFSVGANIGLALFAANIAAWSHIEAMLESGQQTYQALKHAPFPVVGAPSGMALGGGCEVLLHCDAIQAHAESYIGLVEVGVGLIPAWGGCTELLSRWLSNPRCANGPMPAISKVFELIATAQVSRSAEGAKEQLFLAPSDGITMNRERLLFDAKHKALSLLEGYCAKENLSLALPGATAKTALTLALSGFVQSGKATNYDAIVGEQLATVLSGDQVDISAPSCSSHLLKLEHNAFLNLIKRDKTLQRIEHMLETGKPLRN
ncbi:MAG: 3-hydroxyacyl-CoA dehydrogenase NAD-binding domain-containing protein [Cycloclasticus sp.]